MKAPNKNYCDEIKFHFLYSIRFSFVSFVVVVVLSFASLTLCSEMFHFRYIENWYVCYIVCNVHNSLKVFPHFSCYIFPFPLHTCLCVCICLCIEYRQMRYTRKMGKKPDFLFLLYFVCCGIYFESSYLLCWNIE